MKNEMIKTNRIFICFSIALLLYLIPCFSSAQAQDTMRTFFFANSLVHHAIQVNPTPSEETSTPHWFHFLAQDTGYHYEVSGQWGFIQQHAQNLPATAQWGFDSVPSAWDDWLEDFDEAGFDNVVITPANFTQWQPPTANYWNDSAGPIDYTKTIIDWVLNEDDSMQIYIYEGWPDMSPYLANNFPPTPTEWANYNTYTTGAFHDWFMEYYDSLRIAYPNTCLKMIPVGPVISNLLQTAPFNTIAIDTLYEDDAPHGRPSIYFLTAMITYMAMYEETPPMNYMPPTNFIDPVIANNYQQAVNFIWNELQNFNDSLGTSNVFCEEPVLLAFDEDETDARDMFAQTFEESRVTIYPNPTSGILNIDTDIEDALISVVDMGGRVINLPNSTTRRLDMSALPNGLYHIRITDRSTGKTTTRKAIKSD